MNIKEHLQFLAMMLPTFALLAAFAVSLAFPLPSASAPIVETVAVLADEE